MSFFSYGRKHKKSSSRHRRMDKFDNSRNDSSDRLSTSSSHEDCSCYVSKNPGSSSRHFENTFKVLDKKKIVRKASSLSSISEEPQTSLELELEIVDRLREIREEKFKSVNTNGETENDNEIIYFMSRDRHGTPNLKMRFVNSLSSLSTIIRNGINKINDNGNCYKIIY